MLWNINIAIQKLRMHAFSPSSSRSMSSDDFLGPRATVLKSCTNQAGKAGIVSSPLY